MRGKIGEAKAWGEEKLEEFQANRQARADRLSAAMHGDQRAQSEIAEEFAMGFVGSTSMKIAGGHAFEKHVLGVRAQANDPLFRGLGIRTVAQLEAHVAEIIANPSMQKALSKGRTAYYDANTSTVVIVNPKAKDMGTVFQPTRAKEYYDSLK